MANRYYLGTTVKRAGMREVHRGDCRWLPGAKARIPLGNWASCDEAVAEAQRYYSTVSACNHCCPECQDSDSNGNAGARSSD